MKENDQIVTFNLFDNGRLSTLTITKTILPIKRYSMKQIWPKVSYAYSFIEGLLKGWLSILFHWRILFKHLTLPVLVLKKQFLVYVIQSGIQNDEEIRDRIGHGHNVQANTQ